MIKNRINFFEYKNLFLKSFTSSFYFGQHSLFALFRQYFLGKNGSFPPVENPMRSSDAVHQTLPEAG